MTESLVRGLDGGRAAPRPKASVLSASLLRAASVLGLTFIVACSGSGGSGGCGGSGGGLAKLKGGYPVDKRVEGAVQLRIAKPLFDFLEANGKSFIDAALPGGNIPIPSTCSGDAQICCGTSCAMKLDFQSLKIDPQPPQTNKITVRAKLKTLTDFPIKYKSGIINVNCKISLDTARKGKPDLGITLAFSATPDAATKLTNIDFIDSATDLLDLDNDDIDIKGDIFCGTIDLLLKGTVVNALKDQIKKQLAGPLDGLFCQKCESKDDCSSLANQGCSAQKQCARDGKCMQFLGLEGRIDLSGLGAFAPAAKTAAIDLYAAAGGYAAVETAPTGGLSLGMLGGGMAPVKSTCAPVRPAPTRPMPLGKTAAFATNAAPNTKPYHVGAGISTLELDLLGHAFYEGGGLCLEIGTQQVELLSSSLLSALIPSLNDLTRGTNSAIKLVARPTQAPTFTLGKGTFKTDAMGKKTIDDPLLHLVVKDLAFDFYVYMDERYVRFMRQTVDLDVPLALDVDNMNQIVPMLGDLDNGVGNVRVTDSALLKETPMQLARLFPSLLPVLVGSIGSSLSPIKLPDLLGMQLVPVQITSTPDGAGKLSYLGLFLALKTAGMPVIGDDISESIAPTGAPVETYATLASLEVPGASEMDVRAERQATPRLTLYVDADSRGAAEWQVRLDGGLWRPFDAQRQVTLQEAGLRLPGNHVVEVRARTQGQPGTLDPTPARVEFFVAPKVEAAPRIVRIEGSERPERGDQPRADGGDYRGGCTVAAPRGTLRLPALLLVLLSLGLLARRRVRRLATVLSALVLLLTAPACKNDNTVIGDEDMGGGEADLSEAVPDKPKAEFSPFDEIGRYQSAVVRNGTLYISAYNATFGDLAFTEVKSATDKLVWYPVDGLPPGDPQSTDGRSYRGGYVDAGDDVGRFTSLGFTGQGAPLIAYQDVTNGAVKLARRDGDKWSSTVIADAKEGSGVGMFAQLVVEADDTPVVAYMIQGVTKMDGKVVSQLVVARGKSKTPTGPADWTKKVVEEQAVSCAGLCAADSACVYVDPMKKDRLNTVCKKVDKNCTPSCKMATACMAMKCVDALGTPPADLPEGTGLFARLVADKSGSQLLFYNRATGALKVASGTDWKVTVLQGGDGKTDAGRYIGAAIGSDGTVHVAFSSNEGKLYYTSYKGAVTMMPKAELIDDGVRAGDSHSVGAGAVLFLDGDKPVIAYQDATSATLELARRDTMAWTKKTLAGAATVSRGYYPQAVSLAGKWWVLDVVYDRKADALTQIQFTGL